MTKPLALFLAATFLAGLPAAAEETLRVACVGDSVTFGAGVEDREKNWAHKDAFGADTIALVDHFLALPAIPKIYLCHPVPAYPGNGGINDKTIKDEVVPLVDKAAKATKSEIIGLHKALSGKTELFPDKVHPNAEGAKRIAETVYKAVRK
jgi:acyl-CoA thioesterase-1